MSPDDNHNQTCLTLFGRPIKEVDFTAAAPGVLAALVARLPGVANERLGQLLVENTFLALVMPVIPDPDWDYPDPKFAETMVCITCAVEERDAGKIPYLHRSHQLPGVTACWKHGTRLIDSCPRCRLPFRLPGEFCSVPMAPCPCGWEPLLLSDSGSASTPDQEFAKMAHRVFEQRAYETLTPSLVEFYKMYIDHSGFQRTLRNRPKSFSLAVGIAEYLEKGHSTYEVALAVSRYIRSGNSPDAWMVNFNPNALEMKALHRQGRRR